MSSFLAIDHKSAPTMAGATVVNQGVAPDLDRLEAVLIDLARIVQEKQLSITTVPNITVEPSKAMVTVNVPEMKMPEIRIESPVSVAPAAVTVVINPWLILMVGIIPAVATLADIIIRIWFL